MTDGCFARPCIVDCTQVHTGKTPVCGSDNVTYDSLCDMAWKIFCGDKHKDKFLQYYTRFALIIFKHTNLLLYGELHASDSILKSQRFLKLSRNSQHFLKTYGSLSFSQQSNGFSYSEPD